MRKSFVALLLLLGAAASMANLALAQSVDDLKGDVGNKMVNAQGARDRISNAARQSPARINHPAGVDSIWIGHSFQTRITGTPSTYSWGPNHIGRGDNHPTTLSDVSGNSGLWDWDHFAAGYSDSLQGWWPMRRVYGITGGLTLPDTDRPWWAVDIGNQGNYVLNNAQGRTRGVIGYWHVDGGTNYALVPASANPALVSGAAGIQHVLTGTNPTNPGFAALAGNGSAWCGLRAHGDLSFLDAQTLNPFNAMLLEFNGENGGGTTSGVGTNKKFPGYPSQMDQMMYADVQIASGASLDLSFLYQTSMSTGVTVTASTRTGWFQYDPTVVGPCAVTGGGNNLLPNYISNSVAAQPADSFMVYIGVPVNIASVKHANSNVITAPVYDLKRRWLSEVIALDKPIRQIVSIGGNASGTFTLPAGPLKDMTAFFNAQSGVNRYVRIVFRSKTNRGFDDLNASTTGAYWSGGKGAVIVDDIAVGGAGTSGGTVKTTNFEALSDIDNSNSTDDLVLSGSWRTTGKPPAVFFHTHPLAGGGPSSYAALVYQDICGDPNAAARFCNMRGVVISSGDHDNGEAAGDPVSAPISAERERMDGMMSPTVLLANDGIVGDYNDVGVDVNGANALDDYYVWYDIYTGVYNLFFTGNAWTFGFQSYPGRQADLVKCWGEVRIPGFQIFNPDVQCLQDVEGAAQNGLIKSVTANPESIRVYLGKNQQCFRFGVTDGCSSVAGSYFDNVSLLLSDASAGGGGGGVSVSMDIWRFINDSFPTNDGTVLTPPGYPVAVGTAGFDTAAAYVKTGINTAQSPGTRLRFVIPGDSVIVIGDVVESTTGLGRVDMVFRIKPGVGNYHVIGDPNSGLRPVPTDPVNIVAAGNANFWGVYLSDPGYMGKGAHGNPGVAGAGGGANWWNRNVWNSARIDTADVNLYPVFSNAAAFEVDANFAATLTWMATLHEGNDGAPDDASQSAKYNTLGLVHNRCFLVAPLGAVNSTNIDCSGALPAAYGAGIPTTTIEGTKVIPDGLLTPGAHVEYFFRAMDDAGGGISALANTGGHVAYVPETTFVNPQNNEGSSDGHRWQQFGVLPDRWKDNNFNDTPKGAGMACMLYVDLNDRRGNERAWVSVADSIGATAADRRGAHNGWRANGGVNPFTTATGDAIDISTDPSIAVYTHGGQPGSTWDMYGVKASESLTTSAGALGGRAGAQANGLATGKSGKMGPTPEMLEYYYPILMILTGDLNSGIFGKFINRGADDVKLIRDYLTTVPGTSQWSNTKRAILIQGDGFVQSEWATGSAGATDVDHKTLLTDYLGVASRLDPPVGGTPQYSYQPFSGNTANYADVTTQAGGPIPGEVYSMGNACLWGSDVLALGSPTVSPVASALFQNFGTKGPYIASVYTPATGKFYESYVDAWDIEHLYDHFATSSLGRIGYFWRVFNQISAAGGTCQVQGTPMILLDVPGGPTGQQFVDFVSLRNNPMLTGRANVHFGLAKADRVTARVFDVSGRLVRTLVDRNFPAGEHDLYWDGTDDGGRQMERGVYFTQVRYAKTRFTDAKKLTVLK